MPDFAHTCRAYGLLSLRFSILWIDHFPFFFFGRGLFSSLARFSLRPVPVNYAINCVKRQWLSFVDNDCCPKMFNISCACHLYTNDGIFTSWSIRVKIDEFGQYWWHAHLTSPSDWMTNVQSKVDTTSSNVLINRWMENIWLAKGGKRKRKKRWLNHWILCFVTPKNEQQQQQKRALCHRWIKTHIDMNKIQALLCCFVTCKSGVHLYAFAISVTKQSISHTWKTNEERLWVPVDWLSANL